MTGTKINYSNIFIAFAMLIFGTVVGATSKISFSFPTLPSLPDFLNIVQTQPIYQYFSGSFFLIMSMIFAFWLVSRMTRGCMGCARYA